MKTDRIKLDIISWINPEYYINELKNEIQYPWVDYLVGLVWHSFLNYKEQNINRFKNESDCFSSWLSGIPSGFLVPFEEYKMRECLKNWRVSVRRLKADGTVYRGFHQIIYKELLKLRMEAVL